MGPRNGNEWDWLLLLATIGGSAGRLRTENGATEAGYGSFINDKDIVPHPKSWQSETGSPTRVDLERLHHARLAA